MSVSRNLVRRGVLAAALVLVAAGCGQQVRSAGPAPVASSAVPVSSAAAPARAAAQPVNFDAANAGLPAGVAVPPPGTDQLVTVLVAGPGSTTGTLQGWQRTGGGWSSAVAPVTVRVGTQGVGPTHEGMNRTPVGTFGLPSAFGRQANPGTRMPYRQVGDSDWWVSDPNSPQYNTYQHCAPGTCPFDEKDGENLGRVGTSYDYAVVIGYNTAPVRPGAGSAFFVHVDAGIPSEGCVETPRNSVVALLKWLDPSRRPVITIGYR
jgi:L,D-peptidoglycan transpeptidase YkuD (ErfK/YbiS/YcfS/YnhG family)